MEDTFAKYLRWAFIGMMGLGALLGVLFFITDGFETMIQYSYVLLVITTLIAFVSPVFNFIEHPKNAKSLLYMIGIVAFIALISYLFSGNNYSALEMEAMKITATESVFISFGIVFTTIVIILTLVTVVFSSVYKLFK